MSDYCEKKGTIVKGIGGSYYVECEDALYDCKARGKFRKNALTPTVGDEAVLLVTDEKKKKAVIESIEERKNILLRPRVSNIDTAIITFAAKSPDINFDLLDRFLIDGIKRNIPEVFICINKCDIGEKSLREKIAKIYKNVCKVFFVSTYTDEGIEDLKKAIKGKKVVFAGPSGVGKSSIINKIAPHLQRQTGEISKKIERGKHTTRQVELIYLGDDTFVADSPGFTSFSLEGMGEKELEKYFPEFKEFLGKCYFGDCLHLSEPGCEVKENVGGIISEERYERYKKICEELRQR
ncbi:MAG: ribosome small subunit-dependent GTPase A [Firmicutes bacterium]|nr:ribosome small subunit-dependent GTPase A [Bacillota bacterium]